MNNAMIAILKKELARFFGDKRTAFSAILLPGILIFVMYTIMGDALSSNFSVDEDYKYVTYVNHLPEDENIRLMFKEQFELREVSDKTEILDAKEKIMQNEADLCVVFPENFMEEIQTEHSMISGSAAPVIKVYYNSSETASAAAYTMLCAMLDEYEGAMSNRFDINKQTADETDDFDLAKEEDTTGSIFATMLPMLLLVFLYSGTMAVAPESIAGEKERGTMATMLVTPTKRSHIAIGKILALTIISLLSAASSTIGTIASLPKLMGAASEELDGSVYNISDYLLLAVVIISTVLLFVTAESLVSVFSKSIKEAQTYSTPLMFVVMFIGITSMFGDGASASDVYYCIPVYNSVQSMIQIFKFHVDYMQILLTVVINFVVTLAGVFALTKMFESERIVFSK